MEPMRATACLTPARLVVPFDAAVAMSRRHDHPLLTLDDVQARQALRLLELDSKLFHQALPAMTIEEKDAATMRILCRPVMTQEFDSLLTDRPLLHTLVSMYRHFHLFTPAIEMARLPWPKTSNGPKKTGSRARSLRTYA